MRPSKYDLLPFTPAQIGRDEECTYFARAGGGSSDRTRLRVGRKRYDIAIQWARCLPSGRLTQVVPARLGDSSLLVYVAEVSWRGTVLPRGGQRSRVVRALYQDIVLYNLSRGDNELAR